MNEIKLPGFTAQASLYNTIEDYQLVERWANRIGMKKLVPQAAGPYCQKGDWMPLIYVDQYGDWYVKSWSRRVCCYSLSPISHTSQCWWEYKQT